MNKKRIMIVDDEATLTRLLKLRLKQTGHYAVQVENNPQLAVRHAKQFRPDLVLMDVMMPGIDARTLAARFQTSERLQQLPIVFLTAAAKPDKVQARHGQIGGLLFLAKPVDLQEIIRCLQHSSARQRSRRAHTPLDSACPGIISHVAAAPRARTEDLGARASAALRQAAAAGTRSREGSPGERNRTIGTGNWSGAGARDSPRRQAERGRSQGNLRGLEAWPAFPRTEVRARAANLGRLGPPLALHPSNWYPG